MHEKFYLLTPKINFGELKDIMVRAYQGGFIPLVGRPQHFEEADAECKEGPFVKPPAEFEPNVEKDFKIKEGE